ncbi:MAG TPA: hypothetical protein VGV92_01470 [Gammaproteobacteria bacterium]|nr:hypothetical protein [Gammaproteobacteria bacterium]
MFDTCEMYDANGVLTSNPESTTKLYMTAKEGGPRLHDVAQQFPHLKTLMIDSHNTANLGEFLDISHSVGQNLAYLTELVLSHGEIADTHFRQLLSCCPQLEKLELSSIRVWGSLMQCDTLPKLVSLCVRDSWMGSTAFEYLLPQCPSLRGLEIKGSYVADDLLAVFQKVKNSLSGLKELMISGHEFVGCEIQTISDELEAMFRILPALERFMNYRVIDILKVALQENRIFLAKKILLVCPGITYIPENEASQKLFEKLSAEVAVEKWERSVRVIQANDSTVSRSGDWYVFFPETSRCLSSEEANLVGVDVDTESNIYKICIIA